MSVEAVELLTDADELSMDADDVVAVDLDADVADGDPAAVADVDVDEDDIDDDIHYLLTEGERLGSEGLHVDAAEQFRRARTIGRDHGRVELVAHCEDRIAAALWESGRMRDAERHLRTALALHESGPDPERVSWARYRLGWLLASDPSTDGRRHEALELLGQARSTAAEHGDRHRSASCDEKAAWVLASRGDHAEAVGVLHKVVAVFTALGDEHDARVARANLAVQLLAVGSIDDAEHHLRTAWTAGRDSDDADPGVATRLARLLADSGRPEEALAVLDESKSAVARAGRGELAAHHLARARACNVAQLRVAAKEAAELAIVTLRGALLPGLHAEALEFLARCAEAEADAATGTDEDQHRDHAHALLGEAMALYLVADQPSEARRLAHDLVPSPPSDDEALPDATPVLGTGVYL